MKNQWNLLIMVIAVAVLTGFQTQDEVPPSYPGGMKALFKYFDENLKYPEEAQKNGIKGKVVLRFDVNALGDVENIEVEEGIGYGCDEEAVRVMNQSKKWNPGTKDGQPVRVSVVLPISFTFDPKKE